MHEVLAELLRAWQADQTAVLATVVSTHKSAPLAAGAAMLITAEGEVVGSVSGGCVESDVYEIGQQILDGADATCRHYGIADEAAFSAGLTCGGEIDVFIERIDRSTFPELDEVAEAVRALRPLTVATVIAGARGARLIVSSQGLSGTTGFPAADRSIAGDARALLGTGQSQLVGYGADGTRPGNDLQVFFHVLVPPPRLLIFGASEFATALAGVGAATGYHVTVCDARATFTTPQRFSAAHDVIVDWPHRYLTGEASAGRIDSRTAITVLTHEPRFDVPALQAALRLPHVGYIGALGSRRTHADRVERLRAAGVSETEISRISSPLGLDIGANTPSETAVSILAEIISTRSGRCGEPLHAATGPIHAHNNEDHQCWIANGGFR
ncbi:XdhC family protein [Mycobacterium aquaticum]|jgi:xanthine dehydrogenase accessory factor|uniref:XshC-Cox1 family protein n=1 Tax=Mycobacterium aquaticum TaxID=1927124 RepID=A0A1X0BAU1_9MYCO|nr:XdhC/CoxI family protein [Mycobacterium aquaticum]ORA39218.1 XshC-Cox1 family protein [Mycobacterium aquaticum]